MAVYRGITNGRSWISDLSVTFTQCYNQTGLPVILSGEDEIRANFSYNLAIQ